MTAYAISSAGDATAAQAPEAFDIPKLDGIVIDGKADEWQGRGFRIEAMTSADGWVRSAQDMDARVSLGWDERGLLALFRVRDQSYVESERIEALYEGDSVELYLADACGGKQMIQAIVAPGMTGGDAELRHRLYDYRKDDALKATPPAILAARTKTPGGYDLEVLLPWSNIGIKPGIGREVAVQIICNDRDIGGRLFNTLWHPRTGTFMDSLRTQRVRLAEQPGPAVMSVARAYARARDAWFCVVAAPELSGLQVNVSFNAAAVASGALVECDGRAMACVAAALPDGAAIGSRFEVAVAGRAAQAVDLLDLEAERGEATLPLRYLFRPFIFAGEELPAGEFEDSEAIERLLGLHTVKVTCYDADYNTVANAPRPGRYGAMVEILPRFQPPLRRYFTLFRSSASISEFRVPLSLESVTLAGGLGVDPAVAREQVEWVNEGLRGVLSDGFASSEAGAALLAWLHETPPGALVTQRDGPDRVNARWMHELKRRTGGLTPLRYWVELPAGAAEDTARKWPLFLLLHGAGERGRPVEELRGWFWGVRKHKPDTFILVGPRCPLGGRWPSSALNDMLDEVLAKYPVDPERVYLAGLSMGGYACWSIAGECPERFAAIVPICGRGDPREAERFKDVPVWAFHGTRDSAISVSRSREMVEALRKIGGRVRYTEFPEADHNSWDPAFNTPELYDWLLEQRRGKPAQPRYVHESDDRSNAGGRAAR